MQITTNAVEAGPLTAAEETRLAQSGIDTPGCDCGHHGMGISWHGDDCPWRCGVLNGTAPTAHWYEAGCARDCTEQHTYTWGRCALATESARPEPTVRMSVVYDDTDGQKSIGFDTYTVAGLAELIEPALNEGEDGFAKPYDDDYGRWLAEKAAKAIVRRNDKPEPEKDQP